MELKILEGTNKVGKQILEIASDQTKIAIGFGEDAATGEIPEKVNPMLNGLTTGEPSYGGLFVLKNPENCNVLEFALKEIPIFMEKRIKNSYEICADFLKFDKRDNITEMFNAHSIKIKDIEITYFLPDASNQETSLLLVKVDDKKILITGDFRNFDSEYTKEKLEDCLSMIGEVDYYFIEGVFFGKKGPENTSNEDVFSKLKNIMKFYKQVFIFQSETDLATTRKVYEVAKKTRKIFIESTFLANLTTESGGSAPNPVTSKKVYTYNPLILDNRDFEFKKKYVTHFYIHNANNKMNREKYVMNLNIDMLQDVQVFSKEDVIYDSCIIFAMNKKIIKTDKILEEFLNMMKDFDMDYYELYSVGAIDYNLINNIISKVKPKKVIPLDFNPIDGAVNNIYNFTVLDVNEKIIE